MTQLYGFEVFGFPDKNGSVTLKSGSSSLKVGQCTMDPYLYMFHVCPINFVCKEEEKNNNKNDTNNSLHHGNGEAY